MVMARRNRKRKERLSTAVVTARWVILAAIAVSFSLVYVWQHVQLVRTGYTLRRMENELVRWHKANETLRSINERLKNPARIEALLLEKDLHLRFPQEKNVVRLSNPSHSIEKQGETPGTRGGTRSLFSDMSGSGTPDTIAFRRERGGSFRRQKNRGNHRGG